MGDALALIALTIAAGLLALAALSDSVTRYLIAHDEDAELQ